MSNIPKHIVVFTSREDSPEFPESSKIEWSNPQYYAKPRDKADAVYAPNRPKIEDEYVKAGKIAWRPEQRVVVDDVPKNSEPLGTPVSGEPDMEPDTRPDPSAVEAPEDASEASGEPGQTAGQEESTEPHWSELSWPKMRSLATEFTEDPVKSKDQAKEILEKAESEGKL